MSAAKHTPGPWRFRTEPQPNGCPIVGAQGLMVAMLAHSVNVPDQRSTALANASLIAAAPELLEALHKLVGPADDPNNGWRGSDGTHELYACEYCGQKHGDCTAIPHLPHCPVPFARAAIAKATKGAAA